MGVADFGNSAFVDIATDLCELAKVGSRHTQSPYIYLLTTNMRL